MTYVQFLDRRATTERSPDAKAITDTVPQITVPVISNSVRLRTVYTK